MEGGERIMLEEVEKKLNNSGGIGKYIPNE